jgi:HEAT repeat protein
MQNIREVLNNLKAEDWWVRKNVIEDLLAYPEDLYLSDLEKWLRNDDNALLRNTAKEIYKSLGTKALKSLIPLLDDNDNDIRIFASNILGDIKDHGAIPALISALEDSNVNVRVAVAEALGKIGSEEAIEALTKGIEDIPWVAMACIEAIGEIGGSRSLSVLYKCLEKKEYHGITFSAIEKAGDQHFIRYLTPFVDRGGNLRELALKAIVNIADKTGVKPMPSYFMGLVPLLIELQKSPHTDLRRSAFIALSWSEDIKGFPYFIEALNDEELQEYAIKGLLSLGKRIVPGIIDALKNSNINRVILAKILSMLGEGNALLRFADDDDPEVRVEVALAIGDLKTARAKEALLKLQQDDIEEVRAAAGLSLRKYNN